MRFLPLFPKDTQPIDFGTGNQAAVAARARWVHRGREGGCGWTRTGVRGASERLGPIINAARMDSGVEIGRRFPQSCIAIETMGASRPDLNFRISV